MRTDKSESLIVRKLFSLVPPGNCRIISVPTACRESGLTEGELAMLVGIDEPLVIGEWVISYSPGAQRVTFAKRSIVSSAISNAGTTAYDAVEVGHAARTLVETALADGANLSATEAVSEILKQRGLRP